jgi:hypothetical protein
LDKQKPAGRIVEPKPPSLADLTSQLDDELLFKICSLGGISGHHETVRHRLAKLIRQIKRDLTNGPIKNLDPQRKEFLNLHSALKRMLKSLDGMNDTNQSWINDKIQYRPPFNSRFDFPQQEDYWDANESTIEKTQNLLKMISWAAEDVSKDIDVELSNGRRTKNSDLDYFLGNLAYYFEEWTQIPASTQCYYNAEKDGYTGQFFDFTCIILDTFFEDSYHSKVALGKRIVRLLGAKKR